MRRTVADVAQAAVFGLGATGPDGVGTTAHRRVLRGLLVVLAHQARAVRDRIDVARRFEADEQEVRVVVGHDGPPRNDERRIVRQAFLVGCVDRGDDARGQKRETRDPCHEAKQCALHGGYGRR